MYKKNKLRTRLLSAATLMAILLPMLMLTAFAASSIKTSFSFAHNDAEGTIRCAAKKVDVHTAGENYMNATVTVTSGYFGAQKARLWVEDKRGVDITPDVMVGALTKYNLSYYGDAFDGVATSCDVNLTSNSPGGIAGYGGYWYP